jgi:bacillithiol system protein YtxJ
MEPTRITGEGDLEAAFAAPLFLLFKHSLVCPASVVAFRRYEAFLAEHPATPTAWIDVIEQRPLAREVAARTGVRHESPQALLLRDGAVAWHASHGAITERSLAAALDVR